VVQGGLGVHPRGELRNPLASQLRPFRGLVINTRVVGEEGQVRGYTVECDVVLVRTNFTLYNVPVMQRQHGVNNVHDLWVPRQSTRVIGDDAATLNLQRQHSRRGTRVGPATPLGDCDGDMVLLDFIEANPDYPIIIGALVHERTNRIVRAGDGWREGEVETRGNPRRDELYTHHYGAEIRINEQGDVLIDSVGAYEDTSTEDASVSSGQVRIRVKDSQKFTVAIGDDEDVLEVWKDGAQLRIDLGEGATERLVLGDSFMSFLNNFFTSIFDNHTHLGVTTGPGTSGIPSPTFVSPTRQNMSAALLSDVAKTKKT
jgi:hypothetical protein